MRFCRVFTHFNHFPLWVFGDIWAFAFFPCMNQGYDALLCTFTFVGISDHVCRQVPRSGITRSSNICPGCWRAQPHCQLETLHGLQCASFSIQGLSLPRTLQELFLRMTFGLVTIPLRQGMSRGESLSLSAPSAHAYHLPWIKLKI